MKRFAAKPTFLWQGLLIVLPAILLAGLGLFLLRQDRILALHDATALAKGAATDLAENLIPAALTRGGLSMDEVLGFQSNPIRPESDPTYIRALEDPDVVVLLVSAQGELVYPPPIAPLLPSRMDEEFLAEQLAALESIRQFAATNRDVRLPAQRYEEFLRARPPDDFAAMACYDLAVLQRRSGSVAEAWGLLERIIQRYPNARGETGVPLKALAQLQLAEVAALSSGETLNRLGELLDAVCATAILEPSLLSLFILKRASEVEQGRQGTVALPWESRPFNPSAGSGRLGSHGDSIAGRWRLVWQIHERARAEHRGWLDSVREERRIETLPKQVGWLSSRKEMAELWIAHPLNDTVHALRFWPEAKVKQAIQETIAARGVPDLLGVSVGIGEKRLMDQEDSRSILATVAGSASAAVPGVMVTVVLKDPSMLYARQRLRTLWFAILIGLSAAAVLVGFGSAWRAFRRQAQLSELKSNFVSSVSHELRAPLASVRLMAEELEDIGPQDRQKNKEYHRFIVQECRRLSALVENVLDFARHEQGRKQYEFEPTDLVVLVEETVKLMQPYGLDREISVTATLSGQPIEVEIDGRAIQQVLVNLVDNAIKHSPRGANVDVKLEFHSERVVLSVEDRGAGIPAEEQGRIFERFYRRGSEIRRETQGVGLGLAIVKYIVEAHSGSINVRSQVGEGSRFAVELPVRQKENSGVRNE